MFTVKTITSIAAFTKIEDTRDGFDSYECRLACGCLERHDYRDLVPSVGGWAECSCAIVDHHTREFCSQEERDEVKRRLHDSDNPALQKALAAMLYAYRSQLGRYEDLVRRQRHQRSA